MRPAKLILVAILTATALGVLVGSQTAPRPEGAVYQGTHQVTWSAAQLGVSAITLPASGTTAESNTANTVSAVAATLQFSCTQGTITVRVKTYADDGSTVHGSYNVVSGVAASTNSEVYLGAQGNHGVSSGTAAGALRLPQRALSFAFTNAGAVAGTCTARLFVGY